jgi:chromosome segregation ATPase
MSLLDALLPQQLPTTTESAELRIQANALIADAEKLERKADRKRKEAAAALLCKDKLEDAQRKLERVVAADQEQASVEKTMSELTRSYDRLEAAWVQAHSEMTASLTADSTDALLEAQRRVRDIEASVQAVDEKANELRPQLDKLVEDADTRADERARLEAVVKTLKELSKDGKAALDYVNAEIAAEDARMTRAGIASDREAREARELALRMTIPESTQSKILREVIERSGDIPLDPMPGGSLPQASPRLKDIAGDLVAAQADANRDASNPMRSSFWRQ